MSSKRKQRSTAIRKRVEKKQREEARAKRKKAKADRAEAGETGLMRMIVDRAAAEATVETLTGLEQRLAQGPIRGWSTDDLEEDWGLSWLSRLLSEALSADPSDSLTVEFPEDAKRPLSDRLDALDLAAPGLSVEWERGLEALTKSLGSATDIVDEEEGEEEAPPPE